MSIRRRLMMGGGEVTLPNYLCFTARESGTFSFLIPSNNAYLTNFGYSLDGTTWTMQAKESSDVTITTPTLNAGDKVYLKGTARRLYQSDTARLTISSTCDFDASGNLLSLLYSNGFKSHVGEINSEQNIFRRLFYQTNVVDASELEWGIGGSSQTDGFNAMFEGCTKLVSVPDITLTRVNGLFFQRMFYGCTSLETMPDISDIMGGTISGNQNFERMFYGCSALKYIKTYIQHATSGGNQFQYMFQNCTSLTTSPIVVIECFGGARMMFSGCTNLETAPVLLCTTTPGNYWFQEIIRYCAKIDYIKFLVTGYNNTAMLNWVQGVASTGIFVKHIDATWTNTGNSGVPKNWTTIYYDPSEDKYYTSQDKSQECDDHGNPI